MVTLCVRNQGPVIPEESIETIFTPLSQLSGDGQNDSRPKTSLGLGLFVARERRLSTELVRFLVKQPTGPRPIEAEGRAQDSGAQCQSIPSFA